MAPPALQLKARRQVWDGKGSVSLCLSPREQGPLPQQQPPRVSSGDGGWLAFSGGSQLCRRLRSHWSLNLLFIPTFWTYHEYILRQHRVSVLGDRDLWGAREYAELISADFSL